MRRVERTVFISYRRTDLSWALAIFQNLTYHGYDVFFDYSGIAAGDFESVILENIQARAHFLILLTPSALERCSDPTDWLRREIEAALDGRRNIVPVMLEGFDFGTPTIANQLTGKLAVLKRYQGVPIPPAFFFEAMTRLRDMYLSVPLDAVLHPPSSVAQLAAIEQKSAAAKAPKVAPEDPTPQPFPLAEGVVEPILTLQTALGTDPQVIRSIHEAGKIVFHAASDTGSMLDSEDIYAGPKKMVADYNDEDRTLVPSFLYLLGNLVDSFGEAQYFYDQFYDPFREYPAPIFAIPGNRDGTVSPVGSNPSLQAFLANFCTAGQEFHRTPEAGGLVRTAQVQPSIYFTLEAPFVRVIGLYSNCLEDYGVISSEDNKYPYLGNAQLNFLEAALSRIKSERFVGAVIIAVHHPPYMALKDTNGSGSQSAGTYGGSPHMLAEIDSICGRTAVWPHAVLSGHAHNYQRFTRSVDGRETPFLVCGNGGHDVAGLTSRDTLAVRVPRVQHSLSNGKDRITFESYDDLHFGYLRIVADDARLRVEYHPASDGADAKTPDDFVTVELASHRLV